MTPSSRPDVSPEASSDPPPRLAVPAGADLPLAPLSPAPVLESVWYRPASRLPRRGQRVRVMTASGDTHAARFEVTYTERWPQGAYWSLASGKGELPFSLVVSWSPSLEDDRPVPDRAPPAIVPELVEEIEWARAVLQLLPAAYLDWSPHPSVRTLGQIGTQLVRTVSRIGWVLELDGVDFAHEPDPPLITSAVDLVRAYHAEAATVRRALDGLHGEGLRSPWRLVRNGEVVLTTTRGGALRSYGLRPLSVHGGEMAMLMQAIGVHAPHPYPQWPVLRPPASPTWDASPGAYPR